MKRFAALAALAVLAACETTSVSGPPPAPGAAEIPSGALNLGDWRNATTAQTMASFEANVASRYAAGLGLNAVAADLRRQEFSCGAAPPLNNGRGAPPAQVCRRTVTASSCTHTWQVHLFTEGEGRLSRSRALYDRRCGSEGLLGGPG